jgi:catechol 2,3-dioxygenase-like lactoylglutathione lyase family enzyme
MKMQRLKFMILLACLSGVAYGQDRPKIVGLSNMGLYATDMAKTEQFFVHNLGAFKASDPQNPAGVRFYFTPVQFIEVLPLPQGSVSINRFDHVGYNTSNAEAMRLYLAAHGVTVPAKVTIGSDGSHYFDVMDPEGNRVQFVQPPLHPLSIPLNPVSHHVIHVGYMVHSPQAEDAFYRQLLGFRPYWHGGMKDDSTDWMSLQVPDGTDWLEYMLVTGPEKTGIPPSLTIQQLGSLDHFSLGVVNMEKTADILYAEDRFTQRHSPAQIGRDGKWQLNLYAPDETRVEYMEFQPSVKPCCSPFLLPSPTR